MNLVIDFGNTFTKFFIFNDDEIILQEVEENIIFFEKSIFFKKKIEKLKKKFLIKACILSSVTNFHKTFLSFLNEEFNFFCILDEKLNLPIKNLYKTPKTLGKDRLAGVIGGNHLFANQNILVIDSGTAITFDFLNEKNQYLGGTISMGLQMRFKALNHFTQKLPLCKAKNDFEIIGNNTETAIISGVQNSIIFEVEGYIENLKQTYPNLKVIFTGGDAFFFDKKLKTIIFVVSNLVAIGLNKILNFNYKSLKTSKKKYNAN